MADDIKSQIEAQKRELENIRKQRASLEKRQQQINTLADLQEQSEKEFKKLKKTKVKSLGRVKREKKIKSALSTAGKETAKGLDFLAREEQKLEKSSAVRKFFGLKAIKKKKKKAQRRSKSRVKLSRYGNVKRSKV
ncbi:hypothetical protein KKC87_04520 [Patescibacteria group bacterium]|nr:hypothetical protein [Patescibacteria group bacterium]